MYPTGQMSSPCYDSFAGGNYGGGYTMPCCSHGYNYFYPPGPGMTPYPHVYPYPQPYVASPPVWPMPYHHVHHPHHHSMSMPGTPGKSHMPQDARFPIQDQQQYPVWRPPMVVPQSSCCCACPNHYSYYGNPMSTGFANDTKLSNEPEDFKRVEGVTTLGLDKGSNSSQPQQLFWIPPQFLNNLQQQDGDKGPQDKKAGGHLVPFDLDKVASLYDKGASKPVTSGDQKDFPFPIIFMPHNSNISQGNRAKHRISEIEEKPTSCDSTKPSKLIGDDVERMVAPEPVKKSVEPMDDSTRRGMQTQNEEVRVKDIPVKQAGESNDTMPSPMDDSTSRGMQTENEKVRVKDIPVKQAGKSNDTKPSPVDDSTSRGMQTQNEKVRVKDIPVKQAGESNDTKPSTNAAVKSWSRSVSPTKKSKLPPVCLRVDPLPRKKNGNGILKQSGSPSHQRNLRQPSQNGSLSEDVNTKKKEESEAKVHHHNTDQAKNVMVVQSSSKGSPMDKPVSSVDEDGNMKDTREKVNDGELIDSVKQSAQPENPVGLEEGPVRGAKARQGISEEAAAVRIQSAYRGYDERKWKSLQKLRQIAKVRDQISSIKGRVRTLENGADMSKEEFERQRLIIGETVMSHLLSLDTIQGLHPSIRDVRKSVARELISLQEKLDLLHAQRLKESKQGMDPGKGDVAHNNEVKQMTFTNGTEELDMTNEINAGDQQENKHEDSGKENTKAPYGSGDNNENLTKIDDFTCADIHQERAHDGCAHTEHAQDVTESVVNATLEDKLLLTLNAGDEADLKVKLTAVEEKMDGTKSDEQLLVGGNICSVADSVSEHEPKANCDLVGDDPHTVETSRTVLEGEDSNPFSSSTTVEKCEIISGELSADGKQVSKLGDESAVVVCGENIEHVCNHVEKQPEQQELESGSENLCEQEMNATDIGASEEVLYKIEEVDEVATSHISSENKLVKAVEVSVCNENSINEVIGQEDMRISEVAGDVNPNGCGILNSKAASAEDEHGKPSGDIENEESVVTENGSAAGTLEAANAESEGREKDIEKPEAPFAGVNTLPGLDGAVIDEYETPRLSNVSQTSTEDADSLELAEENDKLRETIRKLMESEKDQLAVISTLNEKLRSLERKLQKKKRNNRKLKLQSAAMIKSAHRNNAGHNQNMPICTV